MQNFEFSEDTSIKNFLNRKAINLLCLLNRESELLSGDFLDLVKNRKLMSKSSFFRYVSCLEKFNLLSKNHWKERKKGYFVYYKLTERGKELLNMMIEYFSKKSLF